MQQPTSWMACRIPENPPTHKLTPVSTSASPGSSRPTGLRIPQSGGKNPPPWESFNPLWMRQTPPPTPRTTTSLTWSNWTYTSASGPVITPSEHATSGQSSSDPYWTSYSLSGTSSYPWTPQSSISTKQLRFTSSWTIKKCHLR